MVPCGWYIWQKLFSLHPHPLYLSVCNDYFGICICVRGFLAFKMYVAKNTCYKKSLHTHSNSNAFNTDERHSPYEMKYAWTRKYSHKNIESVFNTAHRNGHTHLNMCVTEGERESERVCGAKRAFHI